MKKIIRILFISGFVLALVSCNTTRGAGKDYKSVKKSVNKSVDKAVDKTKESVENVKDSWNNAKSDTIKADIK